MTEQLHDQLIHDLLVEKKELIPAATARGLSSAQAHDWFNSERTSRLLAGLAAAERQLAYLREFSLRTPACNFLLSLCNDLTTEAGRDRALHAACAVLRLRFPKPPSDSHALFTREARVPIAPARAPVSPPVPSAQPQPAPHQPPIPHPAPHQPAERQPVPLSPLVSLPKSNLRSGQAQSTIAPSPRWSPSVSSVPTVLSVPLVPSLPSAASALLSRAGLARRSVDPP